MDDEFAQYPSLRDRVVFITGGATGIGAELVRQFASQGSLVTFVDIDEPAASRLTEEINAKGWPTVAFSHCDVRDVEALRTAIERVGRQAGPVTVLVNNAANDERHGFETVTVGYWDDRLQVNLRHHFFAIQSVVPMMRRAGGGSIINIGSVSWHAGFGGLPGYTASKAAIEGLTRSIARDLGPDKIRVTCVIPGWIMTERQLALWLTEEAERDLMRAQCLKQKLVPADVARLVLWLAAHDSLMCTRQNWVVDGGWI